MNGELYFRRDVYFRNCEEPQLVASYKFGTNIILHLLTALGGQVAQRADGAVSEGKSR